MKITNWYPNRPYASIHSKLHSISKLYWQLSRPSQFIQRLQLTPATNSALKSQCHISRGISRRQIKKYSKELHQGSRSKKQIKKDFRESTAPIYGPRKIGPTTGNCLKNPSTTGKKSPNKLTNPNTSTQIPTTGHFKNISTTPPKKHKVPRNLCFRVKK